MNKKIFLGIILFVYVCVLIAGLTSQVYLGDEVYHYRFAKDTFKLGKRAIFDSIFKDGNPPGYFYNTSPLWPYLLAKIWQVSGKISFSIAQIYHSIYFLLLILFTYLLAKDLHDEKTAFYSIFMLITMPIIVVFAIVFYNDIPGTALSMCSLFLFFRKKMVLSGLILGLAYLIKNNSIFLIPGLVLLIIFYFKDNAFLKLRNILFFLIPIIFIFSQDTNWKAKNLQPVLLGIDIPIASSKIIKTNDNIIKKENSIKTASLSSNIKKPLSDTKKVFSKGIAHRVTNVIIYNIKLANYRNLDLIKYVVQYLGIVFLLLLFLYFIFIKRYFKRDAYLWILIFSYVLVSFCLLDIKDLRYWLPIIPLFVIIFSNVFSNYHKRYFKIVILSICLLQFFGSLVYIHIKRRVPIGIKQGFEYIKNNTHQDSLILYPGYILLEETNRRFVWSQFKCNDLLPVSAIFWPKNSEELLKMIKLNNINYFAIPKFRIYDDANTHHYNGYPKSFVEKLPGLEFMKLVFENKEISIWKIIY